MSKIRDLGITVVPTTRGEDAFKDDCPAASCGNTYPCPGCSISDGEKYEAAGLAPDAVIQLKQHLRNAMSREIQY